MTLLADPAVEVFGATVPRLYTAPLVQGPPGPCGCGCALTPASSAGFECVRFAELVLGQELYPWQRWLLIHLFELKPNGAFRFAVFLILISRQNGKTHILKIIVLWFLYVRGRKIKTHSPLVLSGAQDLKIAREFWQAIVDMAESNSDLAAEIGNIRYTNGEQCLTLLDRARYMLTATTRGAGRGYSVDLLVIDELREQHTTEAWAALSNTTMARPGALSVGISNQGDDRSVVLNDLRSAALSGTDPAIGLAEWSAPDGCPIDDVPAIAQANPSLGYGRLTMAKLRSTLATARPADWRTENLCQRVAVLEAAVDIDSWRECANPGADLREFRDQVVTCLDVSLDGKHVALLLGAPLGDGMVGIETAAEWPDVEACRRGHGDTPGIKILLSKLKPRALGWFPGGPAGVLKAELTALHGVVLGRRTFDHSGMVEHSPGLVELAGDDVPIACMSLAEHVLHRKLVHPDDRMINAHVAGTTPQWVGDRWRFARRGAGQINGAYAAAGCVHLARSLPPFAPMAQMAVY